MIKIRIEMLALRHIQPIRSFIMIASKDIINIIDSSRPHPDLREVSRPDSSISILGLIYTIISRVDSVMDHSVSVFPLLVIVLLEVVMSRVDTEHGHHVGQLYLFIGLV